MKKKYLIIIFSCLFLLVAGVCYSCSYREEKGQNALITSLENGQNREEILINQSDYVSTVDELDNHNKGTDQADNDLTTIYVHLCGAVENPDVYQIEAGSRLIDLIEAAGGLSPDAAGDYINQAMLVEDGQRIYIPTKEELKELSLSEYIEGEQGSRSEDIEADSKVNINTADENRLMSLPGIGQAKAKSIIEYRNKNGRFTDIKDLMKIPGIKEGLFSRIADAVTVGN